MIPSEIDRFLRERTADIRHSGRTLYDHLKGTYDLLEKAQALEHVRLAGLFHSIYGTNFFLTQTMPLNERETVAKVIGGRAERLVYIFCACNRPRILITEAYRGQPYKVTNRYTGWTIELTANDLCDLLTIELANLVEQNAMVMVPEVTEALKQVQDEMLSDMRASVPT